jgi:hypothetical protein
MDWNAILLSPILFTHWLANFVTHHRQPVTSFTMMTVSAFYLFVFIYKKRHNGQVPFPLKPGPIRTVVFVVAITLISFAAFVVGVDASH